MNARPPALTGTYTKHCASDLPLQRLAWRSGNLQLLVLDVGRAVVERPAAELLAAERRALRDVVDGEVVRRPRGVGAPLVDLERGETGTAAEDGRAARRARPVPRLRRRRARATNAATTRSERRTHPKRPVT